MSPALAPKPGFDWRKVKFTGPADPVTEACSYCGTAFRENEVPLRLMGPMFAAFCSACMKTWWGMETFDDDEGDDRE